MLGEGPLRDAFGALCLTGVVVGALWPSYLVSRRVIGDAGAAVRFAGAALGASWLLAAIFWATVLVGGFRLAVVLPLLGAIALWAHRGLAGGGAVEGLRSDLAASRDLVRNLAGRPAGWCLLATLGLATFRVLRGLAGPPLGWDSLTYHLFKAGRWVQSHGLAPHAAPDAWRDYEHYPVVGDLYWSWVMLPFRSDLAITLGGAFVWGTVLLATYACSRALGASCSNAVFAASAVGAMPATLVYLSSGYVDNTTLAFFLLGALFLARVVIEERAVEAPFAVAAFALMLGVKLTTAGLFLIGSAVVVWCAARGKASSRTRVLVLAACLGVTAVGAPSYLRAWVEEGSPFFPFPIEIAGVVLSEGGHSVEQVENTFLGDDHYTLGSTLEFWWYLLGRQPAGRAFVNPGPAIVVFALLALLALPGLRSERRRLVVALFLMLAAVVLLSGLSSGNMELFRRTIKVSSSGRYLTPAFAALAVVAARWRGRSAPLLWSAAVLAGLWLARPMRFAPVEPRAIALVGLIAVGLGGVAMFLGSSVARRRLDARAAVAAAVLALASATMALGSVRRAYRYDIWQAAADPRYRTFHMHSLNPVYASAWVLWEGLDDPEGHRLAVLAGWDGVGHNWYQYPLLGSRLQNRVSYVPMTRDGAVVDYRAMEEVAARAGFAEWLERLLEREIDHVVSLAPRSTIEDYWMQQAPRVFVPALADPQQRHVAFRLDRHAALELLREIEERTAAPAS